MNIPAVTAHIGPTIHITGDISAQEPLTIAGHVTGTIDVTGHALTLTEAAQVCATVIAHTIVINGSVSGQLNADGRIVIMPTATVEADLEAPTVSVADGAVVQGRFAIAGRQQQKHADPIASAA
jgi:cytoskeletal protein CcmA (bactofilin family)